VKATHNYVMGLLLTNYGEAERVLLTLKNRPEWQNGLWNGIGGKINPGELALDAMTREAQEETEILTMWREFAVIEFLPTWRVVCFVGRLPTDVKTMPPINNIGERLEWWDADRLPRNRVGDLDVLLTLARKKLIFSYAQITYREDGIENSAFLLKNLMRLEREAAR
jgi:8-oxo-dGTP diphosphatase